MKMASSQDVRVLRGRDPGGPEAREQALEREPAPAPGGRDARSSSARRRSRSGGFSPASPQTQRAVEANLARVRLLTLVRELYHLTFDDFCDWYLEAIKPRLYEGDTDALATAGAALERLLKLLHPAMPHVTEEIWSNLPGRETRLIRRSSAGGGRRRGSWERCRTFRSRRTVPPERGANALAGEKENGSSPPSSSRSGRRSNGGPPRPRSIDCAEEVDRAEKMLANERFVENAAPDVVEAEREKLAKYQRELDALSN